MRVRAHAPGRVNLLGDHTDYTDGFVLPMAIDLGTTIVAERTGTRVALKSSDEPEPALVDLDVDDPTQVEPLWARYVAGVVHELRPPTGIIGEVRSTLPLGAGLSSSSALTVAAALALGFEGSPRDLALACQRAEQRSSGVPGGVMDQLTSACGIEGHALLIDCGTLDIVPIALPADAEVVVIHSGEPRRLVGSAYAERRAQCEAAAEIVGPLRTASLDDVESIEDDTLRRRARHVVTENARVLAFADALRAGDLPGAGSVMAGSHLSLRDDFDVSTPRLDELVSQLLFTPGVYGARLTGAGFGGCVVALCERDLELDGWHVTATGPATVELL